MIRREEGNCALRITHDKALKAKLVNLRSHSLFKRVHSAHTHTHTQTIVIGSMWME